MSDADRLQNDQSPKIRRKSPWLLHAVLAVIGIISTGMIWKSKGEATELQTELTRLKGANDQLNLQLEDVTAREAEYATAQEQCKLWKLQLRDIYNQYRDIEDFAPNPSKLIIASDTQIGGTKRFSIPDGKHTLKVDVTKVDASAKVIDQTQMSYDLIASAAYVLKFDHAKARRTTAAQLRLLVTSNADGFTNISRKIFEPIKCQTGGSREGQHQVVSFPNQFHWPIHSTIDKELDDKGVRLAKWKWLIAATDQEESLNLKFDIRIVSEGPVLVDPDIAGGVKYLDGFQVRYLQDGMHEVFRSNEE